MLVVDTCVLLAALTPEAHSDAAATFLEQAPEPLAISPWSATELHSALGLKVRTGALSALQAEAVLEGFQRSLAGRTGYWLCDPERVLAHGVVKLYERHPEGGDVDLNDSVVGPWVATLTVTGAHRVQWLDRPRTIIAFDPTSLTTEYESTVPAFNTAGVDYGPEPVA